MFDQKARKIITFVRISEKQQESKDKIFLFSHKHQKNPFQASAWENLK